MPTLRLKHNEDRRLRAGHLWVFSNEIDVTATPLTDFAPGALCRVLSDRDQFLGYAYVNPATLVAARIVSREASRPVDAKLLTARLESALALRSRVAAGPYSFKKSCVTNSIATSLLEAKCFWNGDAWR